MRALLGAQQSSISLNEALEHSPDPLSDDLRCHRFCPRCPRQPPTMASFFPTADVANSRFDNDLSEDLIRGSPLWIRRAPHSSGHARARLGGIGQSSIRLLRTL